MVSLDPCFHEFLGARTGNHNDAEITALIWSMCFAMQFEATLLDCQFTWDSQFAAHTSDATWKEQGLLGKTARAVFNLMQPLFRVRMVYEPG